MEHYAGIDVSLERSSVCVVDGSGKMLRELMPSEPEAIAAPLLVHAWAAVHPSISHGQQVRALRLSAWAPRRS